MARIAATTTTKNPTPPAVVIPDAPKAPPTAQRATTLFRPLQGQAEFVRALFWGREGSGKTTAALRASRGGRTLVINAEGGLKVDALTHMGVDPGNVLTLTPPMGESLTFNMLDEAFRTIRADLLRDPGSWYAVVIDSVTEVMQSLVGFASDDRVAKTRARGVIVDQVAQFDTDRNDYGTASKMFRDLLRKYRTLDCHLVLTALERRTVDEDSGLTVYGPELPPAVSSDVRAYMDEVLYFRAGDQDHPFRAITHGSTRYHVKDRSHTLPRVIEDPYFDTIVKYVESGVPHVDTTHEPGAADDVAESK